MLWFPTSNSRCFLSSPSGQLTAPAHMQCVTCHNTKVATFGLTPTYPNCMCSPWCLAKHQRTTTEHISLAAGTQAACSIHILPLPPPFRQSLGHCSPSQDGSWLTHLVSFINPRQMIPVCSAVPASQLTIISHLKKGMQNSVSRHIHQY